MRQDEERARKLHWMKMDAGGLTAEKIYRYFKRSGMGPLEKQELTALFFQDTHMYWRSQEEISISQEQWKKISERVKTDLKTFSQDKNHSESLEKNLAEATRERYDYGELLRRFTVMGEDIRVNEDEFDYIYYTYGLSVYGNLPLVEPLEYKEEHKVKENRTGYIRLLPWRGGAGIFEENVFYSERDRKFLSPDQCAYCTMRQ